MRPTPVRFSHSNRGASRRRCSFVAVPSAKKVAPAMTLVEKTALHASTSVKIIQAA